MHKMAFNILLMIVSTVYFAFSSVFAQPLSWSNLAQNSSKKNNLSFPQPNTILSPNDFKNTVSTMNKQTQNNINQQLSQQISKQPPPSPLPGAPTQPSGNETSTAHALNPSSSPSASSTQEPPTSIGPTGFETKPTPSTPASQKQIYSGFQSKDNSSPNSPPPPSQSPDSAGGWNVQY
jgi:hypothetical protein